MTEKQYLITKRGAYYKPNSQGYTIFKFDAGRYTLADAQEITHPNGWTGPRDGMDYIHVDDAPFCLDRETSKMIDYCRKFILEEYELEKGKTKNVTI